MTDPTEGNRNFYACKKCNSLILQSSTQKLISYKCPRCDGEKFTIETNFLLNCPKCYEYWPPWVIQQIMPNDICICPRPNCSGLLTLRFQEQESKKSQILSKGLANSLKKTLVRQKQMKKKLYNKGQESNSQETTDPKEGDHIKEDENLQEIKKSQLEIQSQGEFPQKNVQDIKPNLEASLPEFPSQNKSETNNNEKLEILEDVLQNSDTETEDTVDIENKKKELQDSLQEDVAIPVIDLTTLINKPSIDLNRVEEILDKICKLENFSEIFTIISISDLEPLFTSLMLLIKDDSIITQGSSKAITYIGMINGNFSGLLQIISYIYQVLQNYPNNQFVFLGGYFQRAWKDFFIIGCLASLKIIFPQNVHFLRSKSDFPDQYKAATLVNPVLDEFSTNSLFDGKSLNFSKIEYLFSLFTGILTYLPFFNISSMNKGKIKIFSSNTAFPRIDDEIETLNLEDHCKSLEFPLTKFNQLRKGVQQAFLAQPILEDAQNPIFSEKGFKSEEFFAFLKANSLRYMVRSGIENKKRFLFQNLLCNVYSGKNPVEKQLPLPPAIVRLTSGRSPVIIKLEDGLHQDLKDNYGISFK